jgi:hypothetical protein
MIGTSPSMSSYPLACLLLPTSIISSLSTIFLAPAPLLLKFVPFEAAGLLEATLRCLFETPRDFYLSFGELEEF